MKNHILTTLIILIIILGLFQFNTTKNNTSFLEVSSNSSLNNGIRIVSYNIHFGVTPRGKPGISEITTFLSSLDSDIICLQEVDNSSIRSLFHSHPKFLQENLDMEISYSEGDEVVFGDTGNLILTKYPIISEENIELPSQKYLRTAQKVIVDTPEGKVQIVNTHLGLSQNIRSKQINTVLKWISNESIPTIIAGDFNTTNEKELNKLLYHFKDTSVLMDKSHINTFEGKKHRGRIDYIFVSNIFTVNNYEVSKFDFSDHFPILVDLELNLSDL